VGAVDSNSRRRRVRVQGISEQKATGLGAVAGGLREIFALWGIGAILVSQVAAIVFLFRAFAPGHWRRSLFAVVSIGVSALTLLVVFVFLWLTWFQVHGASGLILP
jgi:hypothetical protein